MFFGGGYKVLRGGSLGHRPAGLPDHVPQLGLPDPAADLRRLPDRRGTPDVPAPGLPRARRSRCRTWCSTPPHSLLRQSWAPRRQRHGTVNADGFGVGWYVRTDPSRSATGGPSRSGPTPRSPRWRRRVAAPCVLAAVRSATPGFGHGRVGAAPFTARALAVQPQRPAGRLATPLARRSTERTSDDRRGVRAAWTRRCCSASPPAAGRPAPRWPTGCSALLEEVLGRRRRPAHLLATDGSRDRRHCVGEPLFVPSEREGAVVVASEPHDDDPGWTEVPDGDRRTPTATASPSPRMTHAA